MSTNPSFWKMMYCGMMITWTGSSSVPIIAAKKMPEPWNEMRANAYAVRELETSVPTTASDATRNELKA